MLFQALKNTLTGVPTAKALVPFEPLPETDIMVPDRSLPNRFCDPYQEPEDPALTQAKITQDGLTIKERIRSGEDVVVAAVQAIAAGDLKPAAVREITGLATQIVLAGIERDRIEADVAMNRDTLSASIKALQEDPNNHQTQALIDQLKKRLGQAERSASGRYHQIQGLHDAAESAQAVYQSKLAGRDKKIKKLKQKLERAQTRFITQRPKSEG